MKSSAAAASKRKTKRIPRQVAVLVDTSTTWGHQIHRSVHRYELQHGPWHLFVEARSMEEHMRIPKGWKPDGVIARVGRPDIARELKQLEVPVVNVSGIAVTGADFPRVTTDLDASGRLAANYLLTRGFRSFAYFSLLGLSYVAKQHNAFAQAVNEAGYECASYEVKPLKGAEPNWNLDLTRLGEWLGSLPKPTGILTWTPSSAREVIYACDQAGLYVPEEIAVITGGDDELLCELLFTPVSGIKMPSEQIGYEAARLLDRLMKGRAVPKRDVMIPPVSIITRRSTDTLAVQDRAVVRALSFIRENVSQRIEVKDVVRVAGVSRRVLEKRFAKTLNRSPAREIQRVRLDRARKLLTDSSIPIPEVADKAGYGSPEYMSLVFRTEIGTTPLRYRQKTRSR
jgi:LacI family transcriptional regulator